MRTRHLFGVLSCLAGIFLMVSCAETEQPSYDVKQYNEFTFTCEVPQSMRSRGVDANGMFGDGSELIHLRYGIWKYENGQTVVILKSSDTGAPQATYWEGKFNLSVNLPVEEADLYVGFFCDAYGDTDENPYKIDWENEIISADLSTTYVNEEQGDMLWCSGMFYQYRRNLSKLNFTLKRTFTQINVVSEELDTYDSKDEDYSEYCLSVGLIHRDTKEMSKLPSALLISDEIVNMTTISDNAKIEASFADCDYPFIRLKKDNRRVNISGRNMRYLYTGYLINHINDDWGDQNNLFIRVGKTESKVEKVIECEIPRTVANTRLFIYPAEGKTIFDDGKIVVTPLEEEDDKSGGFAYGVYWYLGEGNNEEPNE